MTEGENTEVNVVLLLEETGAISGSVIDLGDGSPINEANVTVTLFSSIYTFENSIITGEEGLFIDQLPVGIYTLNVSAEGYLEEIVNDIVVESSTITSDTNIILTPESTP